MHREVSAYCLLVFHNRRQFSDQFIVPSTLFVVFLHAGKGRHHSGLVEHARNDTVVFITNTLCLLLASEITVVMLALRLTRGILLLSVIGFHQLYKKPSILLCDLRRKSFLYLLLALPQPSEIPFLLLLCCMSLGGRY